MLYGRGAADMKGAIAASPRPRSISRKPRATTFPAPSACSSPATRKAWRSTARARCSSGWRPMASSQTMRWSASRPMPQGSARPSRSGGAAASMGASRSPACKATWPIRISPRTRSKGSSRCLARLYDQPLDFGSAYFSPSNFEVTSIDVGNPTTNVIPVRAEAMFNIRYNDRHSAELAANQDAGARREVPRAERPRL